MEVGISYICQIGQEMISLTSGLWDLRYRLTGSGPCVPVQMQEYVGTSCLYTSS